MVSTIGNDMQRRKGKPCKGDITMNEATYNIMPPLQGLGTNNGANIPMVKTIGYAIPPLRGYRTERGRHCHTVETAAYAIAPLRSYRISPSLAVERF